MPNLTDRAPWRSGSLAVGAVGNGNLPNITGSVKYIGAAIGNNSCSGAFANASFSSGSQAGIGGGLNNSHLADVTFDASRSSPVYSAIDRVVPAYVVMNFCIRY